MAGCDLASSCWFFQELMPELPATSRYIKKHYCLRHYGECVRYQLHKQMQPEPQSQPALDPAITAPVCEHLAQFN
ncbi:hypothetical protein [Geomesophilobacter sediminis]|uniref:Uncharacterized protein n=1 Tax=Geomesophilobacter sediminis TaxID=2798584 RepID=A0A8J7LYA5_9BACT|nr:hypothetical protein [Geomesophilobacter sediminis]MBJ6724417.1 hypothetical protein [Geomesophilobacter sediminis]